MATDPLTRYSISIHNGRITKFWGRIKDGDDCGLLLSQVDCNEADKGWLLKLWQTRVVYLHARDGEEAR
jgi:hypothetical protein